MAEWTVNEVNGRLNGAQDSVAVLRRALEVSLGAK